MKNPNKWKWQYRIIKKKTYCSCMKAFWYHDGRGYCRNPKTTSEKRLFDPCYGRARRNPANLPRAWDDIRNSYFKSWKHTTKRKKQWKLAEHDDIRKEFIIQEYGWKTDRSSNNKRFSQQNYINLNLGEYRMARLGEALKKEKAVKKKIEDVTTRAEQKVTGNSFVDGATSESLYDERTENGMKTMSTSLSALVDLFGIAGSMRGKDIIPQFVKAFNENSLLALKLALYIRDAREGQGNRKNFRDILYWITSQYEPYRIDAGREKTKNDVYIENFIKKVPFIGRWDDLLHVDASYRDLVFSLIETGLKEKDTQGLCAKWMPRQGAVANALRKYFDLTPKQWRKKLVELSKGVVEQKMCAKQWSEIEYSHVPSKAFKNYTKAFKKNDDIRFSGFLTKAEKGEVKVNAGAIYPYDVIGNIHNNEQAAEAQWKNLPDFIDKEMKILVMADGSGSMTSWSYGSQHNPKCSPLDIANSLAMYTAERLKGAFKDLYLTFSNTPKFVTLKGSLRERLDICLRNNEVSNTNIVAAFKLIISNAQRNSVPQEDMPTHLLVISDGQFDADSNFDDGMLQAIKRLYKSAGYEVPKVISWNVSDRMSGQSPVKFNEQGIALVSGFSPSILKNICGGKWSTPEDLMMEVLNKERYSL